MSDNIKEQTRAEMALERIRKIVFDEDLAALVIVQDQESAAYLNRIDPTWSCIRTEKEPNSGSGEYVRIRSKLVDYPSVEAQKKHIERSCGIIMTFLNYTENIARNMQGIMVMLAEHFKGIAHVEQIRDNLSE